MQDPVCHWDESFHRCQWCMPLKEYKQPLFRDLDTASICFELQFNYMKTHTIEIKKTDSQYIALPASYSASNMGSVSSPLEKSRFNSKPEIPTLELGQKPQDIYYYPPEISNDLKGVPLSDEIKAECFACAWEYTRCVIPQYTNWNRYVAFTRTIIIGIIAEFKGHMVDVSAGDDILGYDLQEVLDGLFKGTVGHELMCREYRTFLLITSEKTSEKRNGELFRRYVNSLANSPRWWFRLRVNHAS